MAHSMCLRCFKHSLRSIENDTPIHLHQRAAFSTSTSLLGDGKSQKKKGKGPALKAAPITKAAQARKRERLGLVSSVSQRANARPGERRELRKRIILSNTNALEVQGIEDISGSKLVWEDEGKIALEKYQGKMLGFGDDGVDALRALESFKPTQAWRLFRRPAAVVRAETAEVARDLVTAEGKDKKVTRKVVYGPKSSGKSLLVLQAHAMALAKGWLVMHFPEAQDLVNGTTAYQPLKTPDGTVYTQPTYTAKLLSNFARANHKILDRLQLSQKHDLPIPIQANISLARFVQLGADDSNLAWPIWQALWTELTASAQPNAGNGLDRPPVLITMDGLGHAMRNSAYLDPNLRPIHAHDFTLLRDFTRFLSGQAKLPNGGMVLAATCGSNRANAPTMDMCLDRSYAREHGTHVPSWDPWVEWDARVKYSMNGVEALKLEGMSKEETRGVMEYYASSGILRKTITETLVGEKWTLAGSGIIGELERATVRARFDSELPRVEAA